MEARVQQGYLMLADISGFTSFMAAAELEHAHAIVGELLEAIVERFSPLLTLVEFEGDCVYARADGAMIPAGHGRALPGAGRGAAHPGDVGTRSCVHQGRDHRPPAIVWEWLNDPQKRMLWEGTTVKAEKHNGRRGLGARNHCLHGKQATTIQTMVEWNPIY
jgi:hypothetical protein